MTASSDIRSGPTNGLLAALRRSMPRDEFFAGLYILGCANGIGGVVIIALHNGDDWLSTILSISAVVVFACFAGISLLLRDKTDEIRVPDLAVGAVFLIVVTLSVGYLNWAAVSALSLYQLLFTNGSSEGKRGATIMLAVTVPMLWSKVLFAFFAKYFLVFDSTLVATMLGTQRDGNMVRFADGSGSIVIFPGCSSVANVSLAFLCWVTAAEITAHRRSPADILWCLLACVSVVAINATRMFLEGLSHSNFHALHNAWGDMIFNTATIIFMGAFTVMGVRRELFSRT